MKYRSTIFCFCILILSTGIVEAQVEKAQEELNLGKNAESKKQYGQAANHFMSAADLLFSAAKNEEQLMKEAPAHHAYLFLSKIKGSLTMSQVAYERAAENFGKSGNYVAQKSALEKMEEVKKYMVDGKYQALTPTDAQKKKIDEAPKPEVSKVLDTALSLNASMAQFRFNPPEAFIYVGSIRGSGVGYLSTIEISNKRQNVTFGLQESSFSKMGYPLDSNMGQKICEQLGDEGVTPKINEDTKKQLQELIDKGIVSGDGMKMLGVGDVYEKKLLNIGGGVTACFLIEDKSNDIENPHAFFALQFAYKGNYYNFTAWAPTEWRAAVKASLETFRIAGNLVIPPPSKCRDSEVFRMEGYAFYDTYRIPDPDGHVTFGIQPTLETNTVPEGWHTITEAIQKTFKAYNSVQILLKARTGYNNTTTKSDYFVIKIASSLIDASDMAMPNYVSFYINAFDKVITGVSGLQGQISKITATFSYEIKYIDVKVKCIPRMICKNGKWVPDYQNMDYEQLSYKKGSESRSIETQTPRQIRDRQANIESYYEEMLNNKKRFDANKNCQQNQYKLYDLPFPASPDECDKIEAKLLATQAAAKELDGAIVQRQQEAKVYAERKPLLLQNVRDEMAKNEGEINVLKKELISLNSQLSSWKQTETDETSKAGNIARLEKEIADNQNRINGLEAINTILSIDEKRMTDGKMEAQWDVQHQKDKARLVQLNGEANQLNQNLKVCRKKEQEMKK